MNPKPIFDAARTIAGPLTQVEVDLLNRAIIAALHDDELHPTTTKQIGAKGLALIKSFEGLRLTAYKCPADVWTIGYGSTGPHVKPGLTITEAQADKLLQDDLDRFEACVASHAPDANQDQFDAMVSLAFNIGTGAFEKSTLLRKFRSGDKAGAAAGFAAWVNAGGRKLNGLVRRRAAERALFVS